MKLVDKLQQFLESEHLVKGLYNELTLIRGDSETWANGKSLWERMNADEIAILHEKRLDKFFRGRVLSRLPRPCPITLEELREAAFAQLGGSANLEEFRIAYRRFHHYVLFAVDENNPPSVNLSLGGINLLWTPHPWTPGDNLSWRLTAPDHTFYCSDPEFYVNISPGEPIALNPSVAACDPDAHLTQSILKIRISAFVSERAWKRESQELRKISATVWRSIAILAPQLYPDQAHRAINDLLLFADSDTYLTDIAVMQHFDEFFQACVSNYFSGMSEKDHTLERRIYNALRLMSVAHDLLEEPLAIALFVTAIEALLGRSESGIADEISRNVATLLQPDPGARREASKKVKDLYNVRSKALHGVNIDRVFNKHKDVCNADNESASIQSLRDTAHCLAAAVLGAVVEWQVYQRRMSDSDDRTELLDRLKTDEWGMRVTGVSEHWAKCLP